MMVKIGTVFFVFFIVLFLEKGNSLQNITSKLEKETTSQKQTNVQLTSSTQQSKDLSKRVTSKKVNLYTYGKVT
jgi:hypothetical protein